MKKIPLYLAMIGALYLGACKEPQPPNPPPEPSEYVIVQPELKEKVQVNAIYRPKVYVLEVLQGLGKEDNQVFLSHLKESQTFYKFSECASKNENDQAKMHRGDEQELYLFWDHAIEKGEGIKIWKNKKTAYLFDFDCDQNVDQMINLEYKYNFDFNNDPEIDPEIRKTANELFDFTKKSLNMSLLLKHNLTLEESIDQWQRYKENRLKIRDEKILDILEDLKYKPND